MGKGEGGLREQRGQSLHGWAVRFKLAGDLKAVVRRWRIRKSVNELRGDALQRASPHTYSATGQREHSV